MPRNYDGYGKSTIAILHRQSRSIYIRVRTKAWIWALTVAISTVMTLSQCSQTIKKKKSTSASIVQVKTDHHYQKWIQLSTSKIPEDQTNESEGVCMKGLHHYLCSHLMGNSVLRVCAKDVILLSHLILTTTPATPSHK